MANLTSVISIINLLDLDVIPNANKINAVIDFVFAAGILLIPVVILIVIKMIMRTRKKHYDDFIKQRELKKGLLNDTD